MAYKCINFATVKIVVYRIVLYIGLCVSIKNVFHKKKNSTLRPLSHRNKIGDKFGDPTTVTV